MAHPVDSLAQPLVTLGVPVFDGGDQLEAALRALQAQTYPRVEILISDNASTDGTEALCRRLAEEDRRVRYVRQPTNIGANRNFEFLAREARGELFAWCAHDDLRLPGFVSACVAELLRRPEAVLCNAAAAYLDDVGNIRPDWPDATLETHGLGLAERVERLAGHRMHWVEVYGLIRRSALLRVLPIESGLGGDVVLVMKLLVLGQFAKVNDILFHYRFRTSVKPIRQVVEEAAGGTYVPLRPWTDMARALLRVPMEAARDRVERAEVLRRFLRAMTDLEPQRPFPCWRHVLSSEHRDVLRRYPRRRDFPRHLLAWLTEGLPFPEELKDWKEIAVAIGSERRAEIAGIKWLKSLAARKFPRLLSVCRHLLD